MSNSFSLPYCCLYLAAEAGGDGTGIVRPEPIIIPSPVAPTVTESAPYTASSHVYYIDDKVHIGGDVAPREALPEAGSIGGIDYSMDTVMDGVGVDRLVELRENLATDEGGIVPFRVQPQIYMENEADWSTDLGVIVLESVSILNDTLPPGFQIQVNFENAPDFAEEGDITVLIKSREEISSTCSATTAVACSGSASVIGIHTHTANVLIPDDLHTRTCISVSCPHFAGTVIIHELLHALAFKGHLDRTEFPESLMSARGSASPNPGFILNRIDREALQIAYFSQVPEIYNDWGSWSDNNLHLVGMDQDGHVDFGAALFNGLPQPWARGEPP